MIHKTESSFSIDIIGDAYNTTDPVEIVRLVKAVMDIDVTVAEVMDVITESNGVCVGNTKMSMKQFFNEVAI